MRPALVSLVMLALLRCGGSDESGGATPTPGVDGGASTGDSGGPSVPSAPGCGSAEAIAAIGKCLDGGGAPRTCLTDAKTPACDADKDGLDDALEDAMLRSYAPVFAYNEGDGDHTAGDSEPHYPTNLAHYAAHSTLIWRVDGDEGTKKTVLAKPALETLATATYEGKSASTTKLGSGPNFWLCLNKEGGDYPKEALVGSVDASRKLTGGVDLLAVAHPTGKDATGNFVVLEYMLYYAYNKFSLDDHEGDFEGGAVFVSLETGKVVAFYTDRHDTSDGVKLLTADGAGALPIKDPAGEPPKYNICDDTGAGSGSAGTRFWDFATTKHHPVIYVAAGGHASYAYPAATKIKGVGCNEATMIRDVHNGKGPKLVPSDNAYYTDWGKGKQTIDAGVNVRNLGEREHLRESWSAFAGQWGCTLESIPKSYPGPWDNERLCRHWLTNDWGDKPPFKASTETSCAEK